MLTLSSLSAETHLSIPTVTNAVAALVEAGVVREITGRRRGKIYSYYEYMSIVNEGTELQ